MSANAISAGATAGTYGNGNGAGFVGNGESALSFINNGVGGNKYNTTYGAIGGFVGGSFNSGQNQSNQAGANSGHGYVTIKIL